MKEINNRDQYFERELASVLFVSFLGQSNARNMSAVYESYGADTLDNHISGGTVLQQNLTSLTDLPIVTGDREETNFAIGGSKIYSTSSSEDDSKVWWHPEIELPGGALRQAEQRLNDWLQDNQARSTDEIAIVWSQGEADALRNTSLSNPLDREQYKESTLAVFDYLRSELDYGEIKFYLMPTGRLVDEAAFNLGWSKPTINLVDQGLDIVKDVQAEIAKQRDDVQLTSDYADLNQVYEEGLFYNSSYDLDYAAWSEDIVILIKFETKHSFYDLSLNSEKCFIFI